ncbi:MAG TPA: GTPase ObgE [Anaerolineae bacterium]|nr:GTPase ObgE [Anaerolineae bacterium]HNU04828.1 GTPase ObgE [Anaerolineae bacterium]HNU05041.1 GTPase ObgE [Anaerolineae bacterium]
MSNETGLFFDEATINVKSGDGGHGLVSFRREKFVPRGGPAGGNGGKGGDVVLRADKSLNTLLAFKHQVHFRAERGGRGGSTNKQGKTGADCVVPVPAGTAVYLRETDELIADLVHDGQEAVVARGGRGGRGNAAFKSSTNQAPRVAERGEPGEELWLRLELKLIADVGTVGVPNAGKSTLLSVVSRAKPKIADYPFTTLTPNLGVVVVDHRDFVLADIPGLIEGAHTGSGLGHQFLRHIERTRMVIHLLNGLSPDPIGDFAAINAELELFNPLLADKPQIVALNKIDLPEVAEQWPRIKEELKARGVLEPLAVSALTGEGVQTLLRRAVTMLDELPEPATLADEPVIYRPEIDEDYFEIEREGTERTPGLARWRVSGVRIERAAAMTDWDYYESGLRFQRILDVMGISKALEKAGVEDGDTVAIGNTELVWGDQE